MQIDADPAPAKPAQVCLSCKSRHRRCDWEEEGACAQCQSAGIKCVPQPALKFRYHEKQKALSRASPSFWRPCPLPPVPVRFYDETSDVRAFYHESELLRQSDTVPHLQEAIETYHSAPEDTGLGADFDYVANMGPEGFTPSEHMFNELMPLNPSEALLLRNFTERMAKWTDIADPFRQFSGAICRLALTDPVIRSAICAFSARHYYRCQGGEDGDSEALDYQNRCLNLLIPSMAGDQQITASVLIAVALLRQNEEMDGE